MKEYRIGDQYRGKVNGIEISGPVIDIEVGNGVTYLVVRLSDIARIYIPTARGNTSRKEALNGQTP